VARGQVLQALALAVVADQDGLTERDLGVDLVGAGEGGVGLRRPPGRPLAQPGRAVLAPLGVGHDAPPAA
jgi:hypothetical protein